MVAVFVILTIIGALAIIGGVSMYGEPREVITKGDVLKLLVVGGLYLVLFGLITMWSKADDGAIWIPVVIFAGMIWSFIAIVLKVDKPRKPDEVWDFSSCLFGILYYSFGIAGSAYLAFADGPAAIG